MINEKITFKKFNYTSDTLKHGSNKRNSNISNLIPVCMKCHRKLINDIRMELCITYIKQKEENDKDK